MRLDEVGFVVCVFCTGLLLFTFMEFYGCTDASDATWEMWAIDVYRICSTLDLAAVLFLDVQKLADITKIKYLLKAFFLGSVVAFLYHIIKISEAIGSAHCLMKKTDVAEWNVELLKIFPATNCQIDSAEISYVETMNNPHVMSSAVSWCPERVKTRCVNQVAKSDELTYCLRHGITDFGDHLRFIYVFDLIGDLCRLNLFYYWSLTTVSGRFKSVVEQVIVEKKTAKSSKFRL